jgi:hypothetical protein
VQKYAEIILCDIQNCKLNNFAMTFSKTEWPDDARVWQAVTLFKDESEQCLHTNRRYQ